MTPSGNPDSPARAQAPANASAARLQAAAEMLDRTRIQLRGETWMIDKLYEAEGIIWDVWRQLVGPAAVATRESPDFTVDPVRAAERALSHVGHGPGPSSGEDFREAIKELAHGLAACERRRRR